MTAKPFQFSKQFHTERCDFCGRCFAECPVFQWPLEQAQAEIHNLVETGQSTALDLCTGCMACNSICPRDADPHTLIVKAWGKRYQKEGLPERARLVLPYHKGNLHETGQAAMPEDERQLLRQWEHNRQYPPDCDTMMYAGCNMMLLPFILDSKLYADIPIFGSLDLCCGEPLYRMGCWDAAKAAAQNVRDEFRRMKLKRIVVPCLACYHLFNYVYPRILDVSLGVEVISIEAWLCDRIESGNIQVSPLNKNVYLHDNCWPKASGDVLFDRTRDLLRHIGVTPAPVKHERENALCCGMCAAAAKFRMRDVVRTANQLMKEQEASAAEMTVEYCGGCYWLLNLINQAQLNRYPKPRRHILELVQLAAGETPKYRTDDRMRSIILAMTPKLAKEFLSRSRFWIKEIAGRPVAPPKSESWGQ